MLTHIIVLILLYWFNTADIIILDEIFERKYIMSKTIKKSCTSFLSSISKINKVSYYRTYMKRRDAFFFKNGRGKSKDMKFIYEAKEEIRNTLHHYFLRCNCFLDPVLPENCNITVYGIKNEDHILYRSFKITAFNLFKFCLSNN